MRKLAFLMCLAALGAALPAAPLRSQDGCPSRAARSSKAQWPPPPEDGAFDVVHFGEAHWNEGQGPETMPILVQDVVRFHPDFLIFSSDIADIGTTDRLVCFAQIMKPLSDAGIPWFDAPGNHDRLPAAGPGGVANGDISEWRQVFASMPAPWGDAPAPDEGFLLPRDEPDDGSGASTHYHFDYAPDEEAVAVRVIALDNSQHSLTTADVDQYPAVGPGEKDASQLAFLQRTAAEADEAETLSWVVMHQPTTDPRDISNVHPVSYNHTMGKGASPDNKLFEVMAEANGVDGVFLGHIQGNAVYTTGTTHYFIDGGGGGSPYALREVGTDTGYYYGFRVLRVFRTGDGWDYRTYFVPLVDRIELKGPQSVLVGEEALFSATAIQPFDPKLPPRFGLAPNEPIALELRPVSAVVDESVPELAYVWESSNPKVLRPVAANTSDPLDDPAFDPRSMTTGGTFEAVRPGVAFVTIRTGTHARTMKVTVTN